MTQDENNQEARNWAMLCHLSSLLWIPISLMFPILGSPPFLNIFVPLIIWLSKKNQHPFIDAHGKAILNFQISFTIYSVIALVIFLFMIATTCSAGSYSIEESVEQTMLIIISGFGIVCILQLCLITFAAIKAKKGEFYHYPWTIRFLR